MEVILRSKIDKETFFKAIANAIVDDINLNTKKTVGINSLTKGFKFTKNPPSGQKTSCNILEYKENSIISIQHKTDKMRSIITYSFDDASDGCEVKFNNINYKPTGEEMKVFIGLKTLTKRNMLKRLKHVENYILSQTKDQSTD